MAEGGQRKLPHIDYANPPLPTVLSVPLSSSHAIKIHGWLSPSRRLAWHTVKSRTDLSFCTLYSILSCGKTTGVTTDNVRALDTLYTLQPNIMEWINAKKVALVDYEVMHRRWVINPLTDFGGRVRIGEILQAGFSHSAVHGCHMSVDALFSVGMTPDTMSLFHFSLDGWLRLGLRREHIDGMTAAQVENVFGLTKQVLEASLRKV